MTARAVARSAGLRLGAVVVILRSLADLRFISCFDDAEERAITWAPTMTGRNRVRVVTDVTGVDG